MAKRRKSNHVLFLVPAAVLVAVFLLFGQYVLAQEKGIEIGLPFSDTTVITPATGPPHSHVDFKVFLEGEELNFDMPEFDVAHRFVHLHLGDASGDKVIHVHARDVNVGFFFETLGMRLDSECFVLESGESFCGDGGKKLRFFVNGEENFEFGDYVMRDLDRILVTFGSGDGEIQEQIEGVTDLSCIFSGKCPDRESEAVLPADAPSL